MSRRSKAAFGNSIGNIRKIGQNALRVLTKCGFYRIIVGRRSLRAPKNKENRMKKAIRLAVLALALASVITTLSACNEHTHTWSSDWSKDTTHHWHSATCVHSAEERIPVSGLGEHSFEMVTHDPTCTVSGKKTRTCTVCGFRQEATIAATGHTYTKGLTELVVKEDGRVYNSRICDTCDARTSSVIPESIAVTTTEEAQAALDAAGDGGKYIYLRAGSYGTLYLRTVKDLSTESAAPDTFAEGNGTILHREIHGITLIAEAGVTVDAIVAVGQAHTADTEGAHPLYPTESIISAVTLKSIELQNITFTGNAPIAIDLGANVAVDGLYISGCSLAAAAGDVAFFRAPTADAPVVNAAGATVLTPGVANVTAENCTMPDGTAPNLGIE